MNGEGFRGSLARVFRGIRPVDVVLAVALTALGSALMVLNVADSDADVAGQVARGQMYHAVSTHSWWMLPVFLAATVPVLWWRRGVLTVVGVALTAMVAHVLLFGWVTRCGAGLPLTFVLAFLVAVALPRRRALAGLGLVALLTVAVLVRDATTGLGPLGLALPVSLLVFGTGRAVRQRTALGTELRERTSQLRRLREDRVALAVAADRARLSDQLDQLLRQRLGQLTTAADAGRDLDPTAARQRFAELERDSRATLDGMREIVGRLRGGDVALAPAPTVAHLDALLARHAHADARLRVEGDPRSLPASVELSAYRIVEHLVAVLGDRPDARVDVALRFDDAALEIRVTGPVRRAADVRTAVTRARERATFLGGSLDVRVTRGSAAATALLPVLR